MKQENFLFVDVISSLFLLILLLSNFFGLYYIADGSILPSLAVSLIIVIFYYFVLQLLKRNKERMLNQGYRKTPASAFFIVFIVFGLVSYVFMVHLVNIEKNAKKVLQKDANEKQALLEKLVTQYDARANESLQTFEAQFKGKLQAYKNQRSNILRNELSNEPFNLPEAILNSPSTSIDVASSTNAILHVYQVQHGNNRKLLDSMVLKKAERYNQTFQQWDRLNLAVNYLALHDFVKNSADLVNAKIKELPLDNEPIKISIDDEELPLNSPIALAKIYSPDYLLPLLIILIMHAFILIPYFTYRVRKYNSPRQKDAEVEVINRGGTIEL
ncbi:hypothetical protein [Sphingobacterium deserti]|uniref:Uncharacterized protein n=1 Tax=Sphingobacterium deserti TaxID=1229276 RepID=A0A0B8T3A7_9SPHI|nr:hypothetical protein [Sphingobacterium deserti]KGE13503.1 hypothetical protein DI53_2691 [Sphingobacterium deserti]